eukprot:Rhum_TRINITY_DN14333_c0_g2::Rhum_TRINITY_DN14333_c0_g2_i1::g.81297::m.81297
MASQQLIRTELTDLLRIQHPVLLAGMGNVSSANLVAAVSNAGGLGSIGGLHFTPSMLRKELADLKSQLHDKTAFGVDLLLPQIGGNARKTNHDYTKGKLPELIDIIIEAEARIFISAVGVPPRWVVEKLHKAGILVMNMCGHPKHAAKAIEVGVDLLCCQGYEGGGHTGAIGTLALIPQCVDAAKGHVSELTGKPIHVVAAGGISDGRGMAASLAMGAKAVWIGTRFVACHEAACSKRHRDAICNSASDETERTLIYSGRPLRVHKTQHVQDWESKPELIKSLTGKGIVPAQWEIEKAKKEGTPLSMAKIWPHLMGQGCGLIKSVVSAKEVVDTMTAEAADILSSNAGLVVGRSKL